MPSVLILGGRAPVAADHARRFAHQGWTAYIGDSIPCRLSGWSRAVAGTFALAPPRTDPARFIADLRAAIERHAIDLVVPTCEEVFFLSRYRHALPASCRIAVDDFAKLRLLHSKWDFQAPARECNGNVPASTLVHSIAEARAWAGGMPLVLKPEFSRFGVHVRIHPQGIPDDAPELARTGTLGGAAPLRRHRTVLVQHCRPGAAAGACGVPARLSFAPQCQLLLRWPCVAGHLRFRAGVRRKTGIHRPDFL